MIIHLLSSSCIKLLQCLVQIQLQILAVSALVLVAVMMHVEARKASQHILKTAPPYILFSITGQALILISWCRQEEEEEDLEEPDQE
jgi:predicted tellurium resistance membrane protein TerC